jgi:hypothetical protein
MKISELEKERMAFVFLKMIRASEKKHLISFVAKRKKLKFWQKYETIYGKKVVHEFIEQMNRDNILDVEQETRKYVVSNKGNAMYKRGWVYYERRWYDADIIRKYSFVLSVIALLLSIIGIDNIQSWLIELWKLICK